MSTKIPTIHRADGMRRFEFNGRAYRITQGSDRDSAEWDGYSVVAVLSDRPGDEADIEDGFWTISDVRAYLAKAVEEGWDYLPNVDGDDPHAKQ